MIPTDHHIDFSKPDTYGFEIDFIIHDIFSRYPIEWILRLSSGESDAFDYAVSLVKPSDDLMRLLRLMRTVPDFKFFIDDLSSLLKKLHQENSRQHYCPICDSKHEIPELEVAPWNKHLFKNKKEENAYFMILQQKIVCIQKILNEFKITSDPKSSTNKFEGGAVAASYVYWYLVAAGDDEAVSNDESFRNKLLMDFNVATPGYLDKEISKASKQSDRTNQHAKRIETGRQKWDNVLKYLNDYNNPKALTNAEKDYKTYTERYVLQ